MEDWVSFFLDTAKDWPWGTVIVALTGIIVLLLVGLLVWGLCCLVDTSFRPIKCTFGKVLSKNFTPAHWQSNILIVGSVIIPQQIRIPDTYDLAIAVIEKSAWIGVTSKFFAEVHIGEQYRVDYVMGRFSQKLYLKNIYPHKA